MTHCTQYKALGVRPLKKKTSDVVAFCTGKMSSMQKSFPGSTAQKEHIVCGTIGECVYVPFERNETQYGVVIEVLRYARQPALLVIGSDFLPVRVLEDVFLPVSSLHDAYYDPPDHCTQDEKESMKALWELLKTECYEELHQNEEKKWMQDVRGPQYGVRSTSRRPSGKPR